MKIIVGLGNVGEKYLTTRHNAGFLALDEFVRQLEEEGHSIKWKEETKLKAFTTRIPYEGQILFLVKPTTLMNNSGESVSKIIHFFKEPLENLIVIFDDIDLPLGKIRLRHKGSAGTHNGMKSIIHELGKEDFSRLRIGIESRGELAPKDQETSSFVLSNFMETEEQGIADSLKETVKELRTLISA